MYSRSQCCSLIEAAFINDVAKSDVVGLASTVVCMYGLPGGRCNRTARLGEASVTITSVLLYCNALRLGRDLP